MDISEHYRTIASGQDPKLSDEDLRWVRKPLYEHALREVDAADADGRLAALRVAAWLGLDRALSVPAKLVRDADRAVRVSAYNLAVSAREAGRPLLREVLLGDDPQLMAASLDLLGRVQDQPSLVSARRLAAHGDPAVRAAAITLVGLVGGASTRPVLSDADDDRDDVRAAKARARAWVAGDAPRPAPTTWWGEGDAKGLVDTAQATVGPDAQPIYVISDAPTPAPAAPSKPATEHASDAPMEAAALVPAAPAAPEPDAAPTAGLPSPLPDEPRALAKLYGMVAVADRGALLPHLEALDAGALANVWLAWSPGSDPAVGRGIALAAAHLGRTAFLSKARTLVRADEPGVRSAAVEAMGALGGTSTLTVLRPFLADKAPEVRLAAVFALQQLATRTGRASIVQGWLGALANDDAPEVAAAVAGWPEAS